MQKGVFTTAQPELDLQAKWEFCRGLAGGVMRSFADVMEAELGKEKAQELWIKAFGQLVLDGFRQYVKDHEIPEEEHSSPITWANFTCWFEDQGVGVVGRVTEVGPDRVVRTVDSCPWGETVFQGWSCKDYLSAAA
ncbi:MAG: hypothetical protein M1358_11580, partial [Chloroflexi bacterium]|nr:hypothetical protein [Chloroflexota bacterium]